MELWIRSQDRERLLKCNFIEISGNLINKIDSIFFEGYNIVGYFNDNIGYETLGTYKTKERAIEVLDEIQKLLIPKTIMETYNVDEAEMLDGTIFIKPMLGDIKIEGCMSYIYKMPKE